MHRWSALLFLAACRSTPPSPADAAVTEPVALPPERPMRAAHDGGLASPCEGTDVALIAAALDEACAVTGPAWDALAAAPSPGTLRQEASAEGPARIVFRLRNAGDAPVDVPVRLRPGRADLAAFSALAEETGGLYELAPPHPDLPGRPDAGIRPFGTLANPTRRARDPRTVLALDAGTDDFVHSARIRILPGGAASVPLAIDPAIAKRLDPADAGLPARVRGRVVLHVGLLVVPFALGDPARVEIDLP